MKKLLILLLVLIALNALNFSTSTAKSIIEKEQKQSELVSEYSKFIENSNKYVDFDDEYGGSYFNEEGNLVVNVVNNKKEKFVKGNSINDDFEVNEVQYSLKEINKALKEIEKLIEIGIIESVGRSEMDNTLIVTLGEDSSEIKKEVKSLAKLDNIIFQESVSGFESTFTTNYVVNGTQAGTYIYPGSITKYRTTVGFAAENSSGDPGFVTTGHKLNIGNDVRCDVGWGDCGDVTQIQFENYSHSDAAFVKLRDPWLSQNFLPTNDFMNGDSYTDVTQIESLELYDLYLQNTTIYAYGDTSGKQSGKILATYFSSTVEGVILNGFVKCDYIAIGGDSGAAVTFWRYSDRMVMGLQSYSYIANNTWIPGTSYSCFSTVTNIFNDLNLSRY